MPDQKVTGLAQVVLVTPIFDGEGVQSALVRLSDSCFEVVDLLAKNSGNSADLGVSIADVHVALDVLPHDPADDLLFLVNRYHCRHEAAGRIPPILMRKIVSDLRAFLEKKPDPAAERRRLPRRSLDTPDPPRHEPEDPEGFVESCREYAELCDDLPDACDPDTKASWQNLLSGMADRVEGGGEVTERMQSAHDNVTKAIDKWRRGRR